MRRSVFPVLGFRHRAIRPGLPQIIGPPFSRWLDGAGGCPTALDRIRTSLAISGLFVSSMSSHVTTKTLHRIDFQVSVTVSALGLPGSWSVALRRKVQITSGMILLFGTLAAGLLLFRVPLNAGAVLFGISAVLLMGISAGRSR